MQRTQTVCLVILATIAVGFSLYYLKSVLLPFVISLFVVIGIRPILEFIEDKLKLHRLVAFLVAFAFGVVMLFAFSMLTWYSINNLVTHTDDYKKRMNNIVELISKYFPDDDQEQNGQPVPSPEGLEPGAGDEVIGLQTKDPGDVINDLLARASNLIQSQLGNVAGSLSSLLSYGLLILIFVFFLMLGNDELSHDENQPKIIREVFEKIRQYLVMKTMISAVTGLAVGLVLYWFEVPLALVFGFLAFLLNFIPNIGPLISTMLPVPFLVLNSAMSPASAIICFILISAIQFVSGNVLETRIMGKSFDVSPVVLLLSLMFFGLVWGTIGMFIATPIASSLKIIFAQNPSTRPIGELFAGRWVGSTGGDQMS